MQHNNNKKAEASDPTKKTSSGNTKMDKKSWNIIDSSFNIKKICLSLLDYNKCSKFKVNIYHYDIMKNTKTRIQIESLIEGIIYISEENTSFLLGMVDNLKNNSLNENNMILFTENIYLKNKNYQDKYDKLTEFYFFDTEVVDK
jgi:hypothetical protein